MLASATLLAAPGAPTAWSAGAAVLLFGATWVASVRRRDASIVDPVWGPAFALVALVCLIAGSGDAGRRWLLFALTAVWGLRLGGYLVVRRRGHPGEDRRYAAMRERRGERSFARYSLIAVFGLQGLLVLVVSLPIQVAAQRSTGLGPVAAIGGAVWLVGLFFEAVGDEQLRRFKARPDSGGRVMDRGLWRYTRHPNYFGDFCVWWGLWLVVLQAGATWWTAVGPVIMSLLLIKGSGAALLERDIADRRPEYRDYIARTSGFVPLPPRRR